MFCRLQMAANVGACRSSGIGSTTVFNEKQKFTNYSSAEQWTSSRYFGKHIVGRSLSTMTKNEIIQQKKNEALNKIRKIYHPLHKNHYSNYSEDGSYREQESYWIMEIIETLEKELEALKKQGVS